MRVPVAAALLFLPTLPAAAQTADVVTDGWVVPPVVASGTRLPVPAGQAVRWQADRPGLVDGVVTNPRDDGVRMRLTGTLTLAGGVTRTKRFQVRVLGRNAGRVVAYARTPTDADGANQPIVARSIHLALAGASGGAVPLNDDYGVAFATGVYTAVDRVAPRGIGNPAPFYFADGGIGIIGSRVLLSGTPADDPSSALVFRASPGDPAHLIELGPVDLGSSGSVIAPQAVWDTAAKRYVVSWTDEAGAGHWTTVADLARTELVPTPFVPTSRGRRSRIISTGNVGPIRDGRPAIIDMAATGIAGLPPAGRVAQLPVDAAVAKALTDRFGRVVNTGARIDATTIAAGDIATVTAARVQLTYSDGSTATRAVDWDPAQVRQVATMASGTVTLHGKVRQPAYPAIFAYNRADPVIHRYAHGGRVRYLFVATDDTGNNNVGSVRLPIRVADSIDALADANGGQEREVDLLNRVTRRNRTKEGRTIAGCYWAPELHEIGGRLSILFAPCFNPRDDRSSEGGLWSTVQSHVTQLRDGGDPGNPDDWSQPAAVRKADGSPLGRPGYPANISLDMSYFESGGQGYYTWSQRYLPASGALGDPLTWIAKVDPAHPTRLTSAPAPIIAPDLSFEENLAEGAFARIRDGRIHLIYSGSQVSPTYVVGGVWAKQGDDLTAIDNWHKWSAPLQKSVAMPAGVIDYRRYEQGPGHGAFTTDPDGNDLYVYHTWGNGVGGDGRDTRVRRVHWAADGRPILDMTADEEVAPANRAVTMQVRIRPGGGRSGARKRR